MHRRHALAALALPAAATLLIPAALAQPGGAMPPASEAQSALRQRLLAGSTFASRSSQVALQKSDTPAVQSFARFEIAEQQSILRAMQLAGLPIPQSIVLEGEQATMMQQLPTLRGAELDRAYLQGQVAGHRELRALHQQLLQAGTPGEQIIATIALSGIDQHLAMLEAL